MVPNWSGHGVYLVGSWCLTGPVMLLQKAPFRKQRVRPEGRFAAVYAWSVLFSDVSQGAFLSEGDIHVCETQSFEPLG